MDLKRRNVDTCSKIVLDVGGVSFTTSVATLTSGFAQGSWFGPRFSGSYADPVAGPIFVDGNPKYFPRVLAFLRDGWCALPEALPELRELRQEAEFYCLVGLLDLIDSTPAMMKLFQTIMAFSPESDEQDRGPFRRTCTSQKLQLLGVYQTASEQERAAAYTRTRETRTKLDALVDRSLRGQFPSVLRIVAPREVGARYGGVYRRFKGHDGNFFPVWKQDADHGSEHGCGWLFCNPIQSRWLVAFDDSDGAHIGPGMSFNTDKGCLRSSALHNGRPPNEMDWDRWTGSGWLSETRIRVTVVSEQPPKRRKRQKESEQPGS